MEKQILVVSADEHDLYLPTLIEKRRKEEYESHIQRYPGGDFIYKNRYLVEKWELDESKPGWRHTGLSFIRDGFYIKDNSIDSWLCYLKHSEVSSCQPLNWLDTSSNKSLVRYYGKTTVRRHLYSSEQEVVVLLEKFLGGENPEDQNRYCGSELFWSRNHDEHDDFDSLIFQWEKIK